jgi:hypothetical protein
MIALKEARDKMLKDREHAMLHLLEFVDDFRHRRDPKALEEPFAAGDERLDALAAASAEELCKEAGMEPPDWICEIPACTIPWFVSGLESLKAIALVESPVAFRRRKIFVLENFLARA